MRILPGVLARDPVVEEPVDPDPVDPDPEEPDPDPEVTPPDPSLPFPKPVFGTAFAPWAIPARFIATHPQSATLKSQLFAIVPGRFNLNLERFSPAVFDTAEANSTITLQGNPTLINSNVAAGTVLPWNYQKFNAPHNLDSLDGDSFVILVNFQTGESFEFWQSRVVGSQLRCTLALKIKQGIANTGTPDANVLVKDNGFEVSRACGIQRQVLLIMRREVNQGIIPHATTLLWSNPTKFAFEAPATKGAGNQGGGPNRGFMGMRIVWDGLTDSDINNWLNTRPASTRNVLRMIAHSLRDYGAIGSDHGGNPTKKFGVIGMEHTLSGKWGDFGMTVSNMIHALHTLLEPHQNKARVLALPKFIGNNKANVACYPGVPYPVGHPCRGVV